MLLLAMIANPLGACAQRAGGDIAAAFERELTSAGGSVETIDCRFEQTRSMSVLASDVRRCGRFVCCRSEGIALLFDDGDYIKMTADRFAMRSGGRVTRTRTSSNPMLRSMTSMLSACMSGDVSGLMKGFSSAVECDARSYTLTLEPQNGRASSRISCITLVFDRADMSLSSLSMSEPSGDATSYRFYDKKFNTPVSGVLTDTDADETGR